MESLRRRAEVLTRLQEAFRFFIPAAGIGFPSAATHFTPTAILIRRFFKTIQTSATPEDFQLRTSAIFQTETVCTLRLGSMLSATRFPTNSCNSWRDSVENSEQRETSGQARYTHAFSNGHFFQRCGQHSRCFRVPEFQPTSDAHHRFPKSRIPRRVFRADLAGHHSRHEWKVWGGRNFQSCE